MRIFSPHKTKPTGMRTPRLINTIRDIKVRYPDAFTEQDALSRKDQPVP